MEQVRSTAKERRLRQRRSDARIRLRLAADAALLSEHHASAVPQHSARSAPCSDRIVALLEQVVAQQGALFTVFACMSGWQAGFAVPPQSDASGGNGNAEVRVSSVDGSNAEASVFSSVTVPEGQAIFTSPSNADHLVVVSSPVVVAGGVVLEPVSLPESVPAISPSGDANDVPLPRAVVAEDYVSTDMWPAGQGNLLIADAPLSFQQFIESDHFDYFRVDLTEDQITYLEAFRHIGFPSEWQLEDVLARVLSRHPHMPDLLGFGVNEFYTLAMIRRGCIDWDHIGNGVSSMSPDCRDVLFVDYIRRRISGRR